MEKLIPSRTGASATIVQTLVPSIQRLGIMIFEDRARERHIACQVRNLEEHDEAFLDTLKVPPCVGGSLQGYTFFHYLIYVTLSYVSLRNTSYRAAA